MANKTLKQFKLKEHYMHCSNGIAILPVYPWFNIDTREPKGITAIT